jgi:predicted ferric reductase
LPRAGPTATVASPGAAAGDRRRRRLTGWDVGVLVAANAVAVVGLWWRQRGIAEIHDAAGLLTSLGRVTGMLGALLALVQLLLIARIPVLDGVALDRVNRWHRWNGIACLALLVAHTGLIAAGYALEDGISLARETGRLLGDYSGVALATAGLVLLVAAGATPA